MLKKYSYSIIGITMLFTIVIPAQGTAGYGLSVDTVNSNRGRVADVRYKRTDGGLEVVGTVRSRFHKGRVWGHVDVEFTDADGQVIASKIAKLRRTNYSNKHQHRTRFKTQFAKLPVGATLLRVSHHIGTKMH